MANTVITAPASEPLSTAEAKAHLVVEHTNDDTLIASYIQAARIMCEQHQWRSYITQTREEWLNAFPVGPIYLPYGPVQSITSIKYIDIDGTEQTYSSDNYTLDTVNDMVYLDYNLAWPSTQCIQNAVKVRYVAGYGATGSAVPETIRSAMRLLIGHWYLNREGVLTGITATQLPMGVEALLATADNKVF